MASKRLSDIYKPEVVAAIKSSKPRVGRTPEVLRKGGPMKDKTKIIPRREKHKCT